MGVELFGHGSVVSLGRWRRRESSIMFVQDGDVAIVVVMVIVADTAIHGICVDCASKTITIIATAIDIIFLRIVTT